MDTGVSIWWKVVNSDILDFAVYLKHLIWPLLYKCSIVRPTIFDDQPSVRQKNGDHNNHAGTRV